MSSSCDCVFSSVQENPFPDPSVNFPWCEYDGNYRVPSFKEHTSYYSLPGAGLTEIAYPVQFSWDGKWLAKLPSEDITSRVSNAFNSDVYLLAIFKGARTITCEQLFEMAHSQQFGKFAAAPNTFLGSAEVWPGLASFVEAVACDQMNQTVNVAC